MTQFNVNLVPITTNPDLLSAVGPSTGRSSLRRTNGAPWPEEHLRRLVTTRMEVAPVMAARLERFHRFLEECLGPAPRVMEATLPALEIEQKHNRYRAWVVAGCPDPAASNFDRFTHHPAWTAPVNANLQQGGAAVRLDILAMLADPKTGELNGDRAWKSLVFAADAADLELPDVHWMHPDAGLLTLPGWRHRIPMLCALTGTWEPVGAPSNGRTMALVQAVLKDQPDHLHLTITGRFSSETAAAVEALTGSRPTARTSPQDMLVELKRAGVRSRSAASLSA